MTGKTIGPYDVLEKIGEGGMGVVYKGRDRRLRRLVALKCLSEQGREPNAAKRFLREAQAASALSHPNIVTVFDIAQDADDIFIVMEYVEGRGLGKLIPRGGLPVTTALNYATQMAEALAAAHAAGIVHRDLKPGNVIVCPNGRVKVLDFGLAKFETAAPGEATQSMLSRADGFMGTVAYVSPEQSLGKEVDSRADIFSFGVVLHEMLTGERPFTGATTNELICEINRGNPKRLRESRPGLSVRLESLVGQMLEKRPEDRVQSMDEIIGLLKAHEGDADPTRTVTALQDAPGPAAVTRSGSTGSQGRSGPPAPGSEKTSIGVLLFRTLSPDPEDEYLSAGISSEIIRALSGVPGVRVASQLASFRFKDESPDLRKIGESLKIRYLLTGSLRRIGPRIRVIAELADAVNETLIWSHKYDRALEDVFAVQEEIASAIVGATGGQLIRVRAEQMSYETPENLDAWGLVRKAYHFVNHAYHRGGINEAIDLLRRAVNIDPEYALAQAFLGLYLSQRLINSCSPDPEKDRLEALAAVETGLQLAPGDAEVLENAGLVLYNCFKYDKALPVLRRAVEVAPFNLVAWGYVGLVLGWTGEGKEIAEAASILDRLITNTPDHPSLPYWLYFRAGVYGREGRFQEAADCALRSAEIQPRFTLSLMEYANALGFLGRYDAAREAMAQVHAMNPNVTQQSYLGLIGPIAGSPERAESHIGGLVAAGIFERSVG